MSANHSGCLRCAGRTFSEAELRPVIEVVANGDGRSRAQLMGRVCERLHWRRRSGALKIRECRDLLLALELDGRLPPKRPECQRPRSGRWESCARGARSSDRSTAAGSQQRGRESAHVARRRVGDGPAGGGLDAILLL